MKVNLTIGARLGSMLFWKTGETGRIIMYSHLVLYLLAFVGIWVGSGLAIRAVERISRTLKMSSFAVSFLVLGFFTSVGEFSVGINSIINNDPEIFVGNLIGASIVIFMLIVPLLAFTGRRINISLEFRGFNLPASLVVISLPVLLAMDGIISRMDSYISLVMFGILVLIIQSKKGFIETVKSINQRAGIKVGKELLKIIFGVATVFIASKFVVDQTLYFSQIFKVSPFLISMLVISLGTNIPELSLVVRAAFMRNNQVAFGDYVGSAAFNTFLLGSLSLINGKAVLLSNSYLISLLFLIVGLGMFYFFARTKNSISRGEGLVLLTLYVGFIGTEWLIHRGIF